MKLEMSVFSSDPMREEDWAFQIREALQGYLDVTVSLGSALQEVGQMILVDGTDRRSPRRVTRHALFLPARKDIPNSGDGECCVLWKVESRLVLCC
jgi:hypothetical protein